MPPRYTRWSHRARRCVALAPACLLAIGCAESLQPTPAAPALTLVSPVAGFAAIPPGFTDIQVASGLSSPTLMAIAPDGRMFVSEQAGAVRVVKNGVLLPAPFVTLSVNSSGERGVLGIAFDPAFAVNQQVYVYYTSSAGPHNRVSRFTASGDVGGGEVVILDLPPLSGATNHNGGAIHFGGDGKLYVAVGDNANGSNSQSFTTTLGKVLRINGDGTIPTDNPFFGSTTGINRSIWVLGLRNPYTFAVQPSTGRTLINDVGQSSFEEINDGAAGANYGWPTTEGNTSDPRFVSPFYTYDHSQGCAITGGDFYNPATAGFPASFVGDYFFADYCGGWIRTIDLSTRVVTSFATGINSPTDIRVGDDGALYYIERGTGSIRKIAYTANTAPSISQQPANRSVTVGANAAFTVAASGSAPLNYQWQRNQVNIPGATTTTYTLANAQLSDNGARFRCVVTNAVSSATSNEATLTVTANARPTASVTAPTASTTFQGGQTITYAGTGNDPEDGILPAAGFTWTALLWHNDGTPHSHPFYGPVTGSKTGSFTIPTQGETSANIWYRIYLKVTDSQGATHTDSVDIQPQLASVTLATNPTGLQLTLDGAPVTAPFTFTGVVGIQRTIAAVSPQTVGGQTWGFASWSDGGALSHTISTPSATTTYTATFTPTSGQRYEAESATRSGPIVKSKKVGYTGTGYVAYVNKTGDYIEWTVNSAAGGTATLDFRYALEGTTATLRSLRLSVNGTTVNGALRFTGNAFVWSLNTSVAALQAGNNTVRLTTTGTGGPIVDHLVVR